MLSLKVVNQLEKNTLSRSKLLNHIRRILGKNVIWAELPKEVSRLKIERDTAVAELKKIKRNLEELKNKNRGE